MTNTTEIQQGHPSSSVIYEVIAISISFTYFLLGVPTNILSIVVCGKSLFHRVLYKKSSRFHCLNDCQQPPQAPFTTYLSPHQTRLASSATTASAAGSGGGGAKPCEQEMLIHSSSSSSNVQATLGTSPNVGTAPRRSMQAIMQHRQASMLINHKSVNSQTAKKNNPHRKVFELYLIEISICDIILLCYNFMETILLILSRLHLVDSKYEEIITISAFTCRFVITLNRTVTLVHNWLIATMAATRCYAIYKPLSSNTYFSSKFYFRLNMSIVFVLLSVFVATNVYGVSLMVYIAEETGPNGTIGAQCRIADEVYAKIRNIDVYVNLFLGIIGYSLPCFITLVINLVLIYNVRNLELIKRNPTVRKSICRQQSSSSFLQGSSQVMADGSVALTSTASSKVFLKATGSLLTLSFAYLICYIPYSVNYLLYSLDFISMNGGVLFALNQLKTLNHTLNFYIYFATGKRFRNDVLKFLKLRRPKS